MTLNPTVTGRDDLTNARFQIATTDGPRTVKGCVYGDFGLHPDKHRRRIVLDHLPTGGKVSDHGSLIDALDAMAAMTRRRPPIRDEIRHAAEHGDPLNLTLEEVRSLDAEIETAVSANEERWTQEVPSHDR